MHRFITSLSKFHCGLGRQCELEGDPQWRVPYRRRLVYVHDSAIPSQAANCVQVAKMCSAFRSVGAEVMLLTPRGTVRDASFAQLQRTYGLAHGAAFGFRSISMGLLPARMLILGSVAAMYADRTSRTIIYTRSISVAAAAIALGRKVALEMHLPLSAYPERAKRLRRQVKKSEFQLLVVISESLRRDYERELPELRGRVLVAHDGAEPLTMTVTPAELSGKFKVGYVGHLYAGKGMEIISKLAVLCPWATFHIVGGTPSDIKLWKARHSDIGNLIFHGHVDHAQAAAYIAAMDVVVAPYLRVVSGNGKVGSNLAEWMSPLKIFEYMANAKPIVASDLSVLREVLEDGRSALLRAPEDIEGWAIALRSLMENSAMREKLGTEARKVFLQRFTWHQRARSIFSALDRLASVP